MRVSFPSSLAKNELWLGLGWVVPTKPPEPLAFPCKPPNLPRGHTHTPQSQLLHQDAEGDARVGREGSNSPTSEQLSGYQERVSAESVDVQESEKAGTKRLVVDTGWSPGGREPGTGRKARKKRHRKEARGGNESRGEATWKMRRNFLTVKKS